MATAEYNAESLIITLLQAQNALATINASSGIVHGDVATQTLATSLDRIVVKAAPREVEVMNPSGAPMVFAIDVEVTVYLATNNVTTLETYLDAVAASITGQVLTISVASPTVITTVRPHGFGSSGTLAITVGRSAGGTPSINGAHTATLTGASTFTLPVNVTSAGTGGEFCPTAAVTQAASLFPNGLQGIFDTDDGERDNQDNERVRSKTFRVLFNA